MVNFDGNWRFVISIIVVSTKVAALVKTEAVDRKVVVASYFARSFISTKMGRGQRRKRAGITWTSPLPI